MWNLQLLQSHAEVHCQIWSAVSPSLWTTSYQMWRYILEMLIFDFCTDCHKYIRTFVWMLQEVERVPSYEFWGVSGSRCGAWLPSAPTVATIMSCSFPRNRTLPVALWLSRWEVGEGERWEGRGGRGRVGRGEVGGGRGGREGEAS